IGDIIAQRTKYKFFSKLDVSMQYYTFELDDASKELCTIATPFGLYRYKRLPMGISQSPDIPQEIMERVLRAIEDIVIYIDDIGVFSNSWEDHLTQLHCVCTALEQNGFTVNPRKCEWAVQQTDFLGHWFTPQGVKPWQRKIDAILALQPPKTLKHLRSYLGMVNYYRDMWPCRSHILAPLTQLTGTKQFC
ncbi:MAG: reverse transcriptase family protein, partial [Pseudomonadota bacterium]